jgi:hypothetical protein
MLLLLLLLLLLVLVLLLPVPALVEFVRGFVLREAARNDVSANRGDR